MDVLKGFSKDKSLGPDGWSVDFYFHFYYLIEKYLLEVIEKSCRTGVVNKALNSTFITLIPKLKGVNVADTFHPITLCNVIYKIISKLVYTILKPILPLIISQEQGLFLEGRKILDGIIVAHEAINSLKISKKVAMMMKLDMSKAYDRMNLYFLRRMLLAFGFAEDWVTWVMNLVSKDFF